MLGVTQARSGALGLTTSLLSFPRRLLIEPVDTEPEHFLITIGASRYSSHRLAVVFSD
jgi:hypothetical protein